MNFWRYYQLIYRRRWAAISLALATIIVVTFGLYLYPKYPKIRYSSKSLLIVTSPGYEAVPLFVEQRAWNFSPSHTEIQVSNVAKLVTAKTVLINTSKALKGELSPAELKNAITSHPLKGEKQGVELLTDLVEVKVEAPTSKLAEKANNTLIENFINYYNQLTKQEIKQERKKIEKEVKKASKNLTKAQDAIKNYKQKHNISDLKERTNLLVDRLFNLQTELDDNQKQGNISAAEKDSLNKTIDEVKQELSSNLTAEAELAKLEEEKNVAEDTYNDLASRLEDAKVRELSDPQVKSEREFIEKELETAKENYNKAQDAIKNYKQKHNISDLKERTNLLVDRLFNLQTELDDNQKQGNISAAEKDSLNKTIDEVKQELSSNLTAEAELAKLEEEKNVAEDTYNELMKKLTEAKIKEHSGKSMGFVRIADKASKPKLPEGYYKFSLSGLKWIPAFNYRKLLILVVAIVSAFGIAIGWVFILEALERYVKSADDIEKLVNLPVCGLIPKANPSPILKSNSSANAESYRLLYANLATSSLENKSDVLLLTSAKTSEESSLVTANLGQIAAQMGIRVCVVEANLREPRLSKIFGINDSSGWVYSFFNKKPFSQSISETDVENLKVVAAGTSFANPSQLLISPAIVDLIAAAKKVASLILVDAPPVTSFADTTLLSKWIKNSLLVIRAGSTEKEVCSQAVSQLKKADSEILGVVLMDVEPEYYQVHYPNLGNLRRLEEGSQWKEQPPLKT